MRAGLELGEGVPFDNGPTCKGIAYEIPGSDYDFSEIQITGRYPAEDHLWARNEVSREDAQVVGGEGWLRRLRVSGLLVETALKKGVTVSIYPGEYFAWESNGGSTDEPLSIEMMCLPGFKTEQYGTYEDKTIINDIR